MRTVHDLHSGDRLDVALSWRGAHRHHRFTEEELLDATTRSWRQWMEGFHYEGPEEPLVRRAALTLKLCDHWSNGALVAAPTSSLPAPIGGVRNWDYRYTWIRDASFSVYAMRRIGFEEEAGADVYGEILDCAYQWVRGGGRLDAHLWTRLASLADLATNAWRLPDQGIWEVRSEGRVFTYSAGLCQVALDRAVRLAEAQEFPGPGFRVAACCRGPPRDGAGTSLGRERPDPERAPRRRRRD